MDEFLQNISLETIVTVAAAVVLFLRIHTGIDGVRKELKGDIDNLRTELKGDIDNLRTELKGDIDNLRTELKGDIDNLRTELKGDIDSLRTELKGDILRVETKSEDAHKEINNKLAGIQAEQAAQANASTQSGNASTQLTNALIEWTTTWTDLTKRWTRFASARSSGNSRLIRKTSASAQHTSHIDLAKCFCDLGLEREVFSFHRVHTRQINSSATSTISPVSID